MSEEKEITPHGVKGGFAYNLHCLKMFNLINPILLKMSIERDNIEKNRLENRQALNRTVGGMP